MAALYIKIVLDDNNISIEILLINLTIPHFCVFYIGRYQSICIFGV